MYPKQHAVVSGIGTLVYAILYGLLPADVLLWTFLGMVAGVMIDVDHVVLSMIMTGRYRRGLFWIRQPVRALTEPREFLDDMGYDELWYHRIITHTLILASLVVLLDLHPLVRPVMVGVVFHLVADLLYEAHERVIS
jgi:membrane-bound metal-dependent hydrolase YbcI (DUF457 family)